ncbi:MAG: PCRF domain-containing protein, partial [Planctomycetaceae bacterium]
MIPSRSTRELLNTHPLAVSRELYSAKRQAQKLSQEFSPKWIPNCANAARNSSAAFFICETLFDWAGKQEQLGRINQRMAAPDFWNDQEKAQVTVGELSRVNAVVKPLSELVTAADDLGVLLEFAEEDEASARELAATAERLEPKVAQVELQAMMSRPEDALGAYLTVQAGEGGTDSSDWAEMLLRMYLRWCEERGYEA